MLARKNGNSPVKIRPGVRVGLRRGTSIIEYSKFIGGMERASRVNACALNIYLPRSSKPRMLYV